MSIDNGGHLVPALAETSPPPPADEHDLITAIENAAAEIVALAVDVNAALDRLQGGRDD